MFCLSRATFRSRERAYRGYVTDSLMYAPQGMYLTRRFEDLMRPRDDFDPEQVYEHLRGMIEGD